MAISPAPTAPLRLAADEPHRRVELLHTNHPRFGNVYNTLADLCDVDRQVLSSTRPRSTT